MPSETRRAAAGERGGPLEDGVSAWTTKSETRLVSGTAQPTTCKNCGRALPRRMYGRPRQFCSDRCRIASFRGKGAPTAGIPLRATPLPDTKRNVSKNSCVSTACKPKNRHPRSQFSVPLNILGHGCRWANSARPDRRTWENIIRCEIGDAVTKRAEK